MAADILPESRARFAKNVIRSPQGNLIPIYCANCGKEWGKVPEQFITFAFALCQPCADKHGDIAHTYKEPDHVFWERVENAQREAGIEEMTPELLVEKLADPSSTFAKLAEEWRRHALK